MEPYPSLPTVILHAVFSTKRQKPLITPEIRPFLYSFIEGVVEKEAGIVIEVGGMPDHIHLLASFSPERSVDYMVRTIKSSSADWVNEKTGPEEPFAWQESYCVVSVDQPAALDLRETIRRQAEIHEHKTFREEFIELLEAHEIEFDKDDEELWE